MPALQLKLLHNVISNVERSVRLFIAHSTSRILCMVLQRTCLTEVMQALGSDWLSWTLRPVSAEHNKLSENTQQSPKARFLRQGHCFTHLHSHMYTVAWKLQDEHAPSADVTCKWQLLFVILLLCALLWVSPFYQPLLDLLPLCLLLGLPVLQARVAV